MDRTEIVHGACIFRLSLAHAEYASASPPGAKPMHWVSHFAPGFLNNRAGRGYSVKPAPIANPERPHG